MATRKSDEASSLDWSATERSQRLSAPDDALFAEQFAEDAEGVPVWLGLSVVVGMRWCGIVDRVPNVLYVATYFFHILWIPLVPLQTWIIVVDDHGCNSVTSRQVRWQFKSIGIAFLRTLLALSAVVAGMAGAGGLIALAKGFTNLLLPLAWLAGAGLLSLAYWLTFRLMRPSRGRVVELALQAGFPEDAAQQVADTFDWGRTGDADADWSAIVCRGCGRELAATTRVCPRCEQRVETR